MPVDAGLPRLPTFRFGGRVAAPTEAQKKAGNYKKGHTRVHGLDITIENLKGSKRSGTDKGGKPWSVTMPADYGYFKRTEGKDGDHVDCYVGPDAKSEIAFVIDQVDADSGKFDEHKVMLGFVTAKDAQEAYTKAFSDGRAKDRLGHLKAMTIDQLKAWLRSGNTKRPIEPQKFANGGAVLPRIAFASGGTVKGPLHSTVPGRTDHLPMEVTAGSFVVPADIVSALGEGNSNAGMQILDQMFPEVSNPQAYAKGGAVPILAAGGEYVLSPAQVAAVGGGDVDKGHAILDKWVVETRKHTIKTLSKLPAPAKD